MRFDRLTTTARRLLLAGATLAGFWLAAAANWPKH